MTYGRAKELTLLIRQLQDQPAQRRELSPVGASDSSRIAANASARAADLRKRVEPRRSVRS
jgi:hypothetical protein